MQITVSNLGLKYTAVQDDTDYESNQPALEHNNSNLDLQSTQEDAVSSPHPSQDYGNFPPAQHSPPLAHEELSDPDAVNFHEILRDQEQESYSALDDIDYITAERILDQSEAFIQNSEIDQLNLSLDDIFDNTLESDEELIEPPSPIFKRNTNNPVTWPLVQNTAPTTPTRGPQILMPKLEPIFEMSNIDLKGKLVQIINFSGADDRKTQLKLKISDGESWIEVVLDESYRIYLYSKMMEMYHLITILDYTGSIEMCNITLVMYIDIISYIYLLIF